MASIKRTVAQATTIDLNRVVTWVRVVEAGSFTAAARSLAVPKSSVSRAIQKLEDELGLVLLQRTTRKLTLTRAGERYLVSAREALRLLDEGRTEVLNEDGAIRGNIRLTVPFDNGHLSRSVATALAMFMARYPQISIEVLVTGRRVDLLAENVDLAVRAGTLDGSDLVARKLVTEALVLVASPAYLRAHGTPKRLADLAQHQVVLFKAAQGTQRLKLSGPSGVESVTVRGAIDVDDMAFQIPLAENGVGIALIPALAAEASLRNGQLERVLPQYSRKDAALHLVSAASRHLPKRVTLLRDFLFEQLKRDLAACAR